MDELNLSEIGKKLNEVFSSGNQLVFWYDTTGAFEDSVDDLKLGQVKVLHLTDRNAFRAKITLEHDDPESQYLVYRCVENCLNRKLTEWPDRDVLSDETHLTGAKSSLWKKRAR